FYAPHAVAVDMYKNIYIADTFNGRIREVNALTGIVTTVAGTGGDDGYTGDGGPATLAKMNDPTGIAVDKSGNMYIADSENQVIRKVDAKTRIITTFAGNGVRGYTGDGGPATAATFNAPFALTVDSQGNVYVADFFNSAIRKIDAQTNIISTVAGNGTWGYS